MMGVCESGSMGEIAREMVLSTKKPDAHVARLLARQCRQADVGDDLVVALEGYAAVWDEQRALEEELAALRRRGIEQWRGCVAVARAGGQMDLVEEARRGAAKDEGGRMKDKDGCEQDGADSGRDGVRQDGAWRAQGDTLSVQRIVDAMERAGLAGLAVDDLQMDALNLARTIGAVVRGEVEKRPGQVRVSTLIDRENHQGESYAQVRLELAANCENPDGEWVTNVRLLARETAGGPWYLSGTRWLVMSPAVGSLAATIFLDTRDRERVRLLGMLADALRSVPGFGDDAEPVAALAEAVKEKLGRKVRKGAKGGAG